MFFHEMFLEQPQLYEPQLELKWMQNISTRKSIDGILVTELLISYSRINPPILNSFLEKGKD